MLVLNMGIVEEIMNFLGKSLKNATMELERTARRNVEMRVRRVQRFVFRQAFMLIFFALAAFSLFMTLVFGSIEYLHFTKTLSFLMVGVIALFIGVLIKALN